MAGCVQLVPHVTQTGVNTYHLKTSGSSVASMSTLENKLDKKAEDICKGKGYEKVSEDQSLKKSNAYTQGLIVPVGQIFAERNIKCNE